MSDLAILLTTLIDEMRVFFSQQRQCVVRQFEFPQAKNMIKVAIGMRRAGKTFFLYQTINELLAQGVAIEQILMINFEDDRLLPIDAKKMGALLDTFYTLYPENHNRCCYIFLDEVQNVPEWHIVVRRYFDSKNVQLYLTGSSAKFLSKEIATSLRGRSLAVEIWPYNFAEYLTAHNTAIPSGQLGQRKFDLMQRQLLDFFAVGGFPAVQVMLSNEWRDALQNYVDTVVLKDIVERYRVSNITLLKYLIATVLKNAAAPFSVNKFHNDVSSQGYKVSKDTIHVYMEHIEDTFLAFTVPFYSESLRVKKNIPKKIYAIDNGLINVHSLGTNAQHNKQFENQIYLDLRRQRKDIYFYRTEDGYEVDFVTVDKQGNRELIQAVFDATDQKTIEREQRALQKAEKELGISGRIVTFRDYLNGAITKFM